ncbi:MAG: hypothetical protein CL503_05340 [Actinobacteria bacterium]|nr:hypothetical protein [Actinomycetota bacterium]
MYLINIIIITILMLFNTVYGSNFSLISDIGASAQSIALGNIEGSSRTADAIFSNPAGLYQIKNYSVSLFQATVMNDINYINASLCKHTRYGNFGIGYYSSSVENIPFTFVDPTNNNEFMVKNMYSYKNQIAKLAYQMKVTRRFHVGLNYTKYKVDFHDIYASGYGFDLGILKIFKYFTLSTFIQNINQGNVTYKSTSDANYTATEKVPLSVSSSLRIAIWDFILYPQLKVHNNYFLPSVGIQYRPSFLPFLKLNSGFRQLLDYANQKHAKASFGVDLKLSSLNFHYAYERSEYILQDHTSYFSFTYNFKVGNSKKPGIAGKSSSALFLLPLAYVLSL